MGQVREAHVASAGCTAGLHRQEGVVIPVFEVAFKAHRASMSDPGAGPGIEMGGQAPPASATGWLSTPNLDNSAARIPFVHGMKCKWGEVLTVDKHHRNAVPFY